MWLKEDVIEDEQSVRGVKRESEVEDREEIRRRKLELEQGTKRSAEDEFEQPVTTKLRIEMMEKDELHEEVEEEMEWMWNEVDYDAVTGQSLDPKLVKRGKEEEMRRFEEMKVYEYVTQSQALEDPEGVIIDVRWVVVNKGTPEEPNVRCRLVGREFADKGNRDDLFAGTPPLVTIRTLLSVLSKRAFCEEEVGAMVLDVNGAFLYWKTKRNVYIWLPPEDPRSQEGLMGKLNKAMYGT